MNADVAVIVRYLLVHVLVQHPPPSPTSVRHLHAVTLTRPRQLEYKHGAII